MGELVSFDIGTVTINNHDFRKVMIDWKHISIRHPDVTQTLVLQAVRQLGGRHLNKEVTKPPYKYFVSLLKLNEKNYRLIWLLEEGQDYVGVLNLYRDDRKNNGISTEK